MKNHKNVFRPVYIVIAVVALLGVLWSYMFITASRQQTLDQRVQHVASQLKCPICQGESVADSPSGLAQQMRGIIRQKLQAGESEQQIIQFFVDRYGEQIVWSPPWWGFSLLAWLVPILLLLIGFSAICFTLRDWRIASSLAIKTSSAQTGDDEPELLTEREQVARNALQEVELDYQLGNISETDYNTLRERYMRRALVAMKSHYEHEQEIDELIEEQVRQLREKEQHATE